jgi:hypothetical protein
VEYTFTPYDLPLFYGLSQILQDAFAPQKAGVLLK